MSRPEPAPDDEPLPEEDQARADCYAILARLYYDAPDAQLLAAIGAAGNPEANENAFGASWRELAAAAAAANPAGLRAEFDALFAGPGKAEVTPYMSFYLVPTGRERVLADLRAALARLGLARTASATEPEDHIAALCDVMRHLIISGSRNAAPQEVTSFFNMYILSGYHAFCNALISSPGAAFYRRVARFTEAFLDLEVESFDRS